MSAQLNIRGNIIELEEEITYNFQVGDIADFSALKSNYTSSFQIPKTQNVVQLFEGLGIPSDISGFPYTITDVQCLDDYTIVYEGSLVILRTDSLYYHATVISGVHDLGSVLGDATLYDAGLRLIPKTVDNVFYNSRLLTPIIPDTFFFLPPFVSDRNQVNEQGIYRANVDVLAQAFKLDYIIDAIFQFANFTYSFPSTIDLENEVLAVPSPPALDSSIIDFRGLWAATNNVSTSNYNPGEPLGLIWGSTDIQNIYFIESGQNGFQCQASGDYVFIFEYFQVSASLNSGSPFFTPYGGFHPCRVELRVNDEVIGAFAGDLAGTDTGSEKYRTIATLSVGDIVTISIQRPAGMDDKLITYTRGETSFKIYTLEINEEKEREALSFRLSQFVKEICYRYFLTPLQRGNHIEFISIYDILNEWDTLDWSDKYISRSNEEYTADYANNNWLRHRYVPDGDESFDLNLYSGNNNAAMSRDMIVSNIFAPSENASRLLDYEIFEVEVKDNGETKYKTNNRFFFARAELIFRSSTTCFVSNTIPGELCSPDAYYVFPEYTAAFSDSARWRSLERVIQGLRVHNIDLHLTSIDASQLDITRIYFFDQEQSYYMLNRMSYTKGKKTTAEFVKIHCAWGWEGINPYCVIDNDGFNTGVLGYNDLRNYFTWEVKPNTPSDEDYIEPIQDLDDCPPFTEAVIFDCFDNVSGQDSSFAFNIISGGSLTKASAIVGNDFDNPADVSIGTGETKSLNWSPWASDFTILFKGYAELVTDIERGNRPIIIGADLTSFVNLERVILNNLRYPADTTISLPDTPTLLTLDLLNSINIPSRIDGILTHLDNQGGEGGTFRYGADSSSGVQPTNTTAYDNLISKGWTIIGRPPL